MTAESGWLRKGLFRGERIIRTALSILLAPMVALTMAACVFSQGVRPQPQSPKPTMSPHLIQETPSPSSPPAVWVLAPVGVNLRQDPDTAANRLTTLRQGAQLDILESRTVGSRKWLRVRTQSGQFEGWIVDDPDLIVKVPVELHIDSSATGNYSVLAPRGWAVKTGNPSTYTSPPSDPEGAEMLIQTAPDLDKLPSTPTAAAKEQRQEQVEVYGKTGFLTVYKVDAGGWQFASKLKFKNRAYLFLFRTTKGDGVTDFFKQLLSSVIVTDEPPPG